VGLLALKISTVASGSSKDGRLCGSWPHNRPRYARSTRPGAAVGSFPSVML
jgi:hypothetical protein